MASAAHPHPCACQHCLCQRGFCQHFCCIFISSSAISLRHVPAREDLADVPHYRQWTDMEIPRDILYGLPTPACRCAASGNATRGTIDVANEQIVYLCHRLCGRTPDMPTRTRLSRRSLWDNAGSCHVPACPSVTTRIAADNRAPRFTFAADNVAIAHALQ